MLNCQKHLFSLRPDIHYLNCAYKAPLLKSAENAAMQALIRERNPIDIATSDFFSMPEQVRRGFGKLVNCPPSQIAIIPSVSYGLSSVLNNIIPKSHQTKAITIKDEFPSGYFSLKTWCKRHQKSLVIASPDPNLELIGEQWNEQVLERIDEQTAIVLLSSIHWTNGLKFDLQRIGEKCAQVGAYFIVDGTQSVGAMPMDIKKFRIDALICAGYKWLLGPYSLGLAYISPKFSQGMPLEEAWINRASSRDFTNLTSYDSNYSQGAGRFNVGQNSNFILMPMLHEALKQLNAWGTHAIQNYCQQLTLPLKAYFKDTGVAQEPEGYVAQHLFALKLPMAFDIQKMKTLLEAQKVYVSIRGKDLRVSVNVFNDEADIQALLNAIITAPV